MLQILWWIYLKLALQMTRHTPGIMPSSFVRGHLDQVLAHIGPRQCPREKDGLEEFLGSETKLLRLTLGDSNHDALFLFIVPFCSILFHYILHVIIPDHSWLFLSILSILPFCPCSFSVYWCLWATCIGCNKATVESILSREISGVTHRYWPLHISNPRCVCLNFMPARPSAQEPGICPTWAGLRMRGSLVEVKVSLDSLAYRLEDLAAREHALRAQEAARSGTNQGISLPKNATCLQTFLA